MISVLVGLLVLTIIIAIHEAAHMLVAKWNGIKVPVYSIGIGPVLLSKKWGETEYRISAIPLGGYVQLAGHMKSKEECKDIPEDRLFDNKTAWQRFAVIAAGPVSNYVLTFLILSSLYFMCGRMVTTTEIKEVLEDTPAAKAGLRSGDKIISVDDAKIENFSDLYFALNKGKNEEVELGFLREGNRHPLSVKIVPEEKIFTDEIMNSTRSVRVIGVMLVDPIFVDKYRPLQSIGRGLTDIYMYNKLSLLGLYDIVSGKAKAKDNLAGPITIIRMSGRAAKHGIIVLIGFVAMISFAIGFMNFLPIPGLDGCYMLFYLIEIIRGKPIARTTQIMILNYGVILLIMLFIYILFLDISRLM